jgi:hypothetical protein
MGKKPRKPKQLHNACGTTAKCNSFPRLSSQQGVDYFKGTPGSAESTSTNTCFSPSGSAASRRPGTELGGEPALSASVKYVSTSTLLVKGLALLTRACLYLCTSGIQQQLLSCNWDWHERHCSCYSTACPAWQRHARCVAAGSGMQP